MLMLLHPGEPLEPHDLLAAWTFEPGVLAALGLLSALYIVGILTAWRRAGAGRGMGRGTILAFAGSIVVLLVALVSPLDALSGSLFSAHMTQHMVLILAAAPLLARSQLMLVLAWALPKTWRRKLAQAPHRSAWLGSVWRASHALRAPAAAWILFTVAFWAWHAPFFYEWALDSEQAHALEHLVLLATAWLFWSVLFEQTGPTRKRVGIAIPYLFTTMLQSGIFGAILTFASRPWYAYYSPALVSPWGLTPLQDQQLAGLIMWVPGGLVFTLLTIGHFASWLQAWESRETPTPNQ